MNKLFEEFRHLLPAIPPKKVRDDPEGFIALVLKAHESELKRLREIIRPIRHLLPTKAHILEQQVQFLVDNYKASI